MNPEDPEALTPNHFLLGGSARAPVPGTFDDRDLIGRNHRRTSQRRLADLFWTRWMKEYLPDLQYRRELHSRGPPLKVGDVFLIADHTLPGTSGGDLPRSRRSSQSSRHIDEGRNTATRNQETGDPAYRNGRPTTVTEGMQRPRGRCTAGVICGTTLELSFVK